MPLYSPAYQGHPACRAYEAELDRIRHEWDNANPGGYTFWREANAARNARADAASLAALERLTASLAAEGLVARINCDPRYGYYVDLFPVDSSPHPSWVDLLEDMRKEQTAIAAFRARREHEE